MSLHFLSSAVVLFSQFAASRQVANVADSMTCFCAVRIVAVKVISYSQETQGFRHCFFGMHFGRRPLQSMSSA
jgi:hypothetical protein